VIDAAELRRMQDLRHRSPRIVLALTETDRHPSWPQVLEADLDRLRAAGVTAAPFPVSIDLHRRAVAVGDSGFAAASGVPALARYLDGIAEQAALSAARSVAHDVLNALSELEAASPAAPPVSLTPAAGKTQQPGARRSRTRPANAQPGAGPERGTPERGRWQQVLSDGMAAVSSDVDFDLRSRVRAAVADAERVVEESDPARNWDDIDKWLRARLSYEGEQTLALLSKRTAQVAAALERELGGGPLRPVAPAPVPDLFGHLPDRDAPTGNRRSVATRSRSLVMSVYGGLMMALILPRFAGIELPMWVVIGGAVTAALLLGGATLAGERKRQLEARRSRAKSLVRHCADGFLLGAGKYTRDTLRGAQQQLRDECATRTGGPRRGDRPRKPGTAGEGATAPNQNQKAAAPPADLDDLRRRARGLLGRSAGAA
jgi:hypothetical protein